VTVPCLLSEDLGTKAREVRSVTHESHAVEESSCLGMQLEECVSFATLPVATHGEDQQHATGGKFHPRLNTGERETDSEQVPRGKDEKNFEERVKQCLRLSRGKRWWLHRLFFLS